MCRRPYAITLVVTRACTEQVVGRRGDGGYRGGATDEQRQY